MRTFKKALLPIIAALCMLGAIAAPAGAMPNTSGLYDQTYAGTPYNECSWRSAAVGYSGTYGISFDASVGYSIGGTCAVGAVRPPTQLQIKVQLQSYNITNGVGTNIGTPYDYTNAYSTSLVVTPHVVKNVPTGPYFFRWVIAYSVYTDGLGWRTNLWVSDILHV